MYLSVATLPWHWHQETWACLFWHPWVPGSYCLFWLDIKFRSVLIIEIHWAYSTDKLYSWKACGKLQTGNPQHLRMSAMANKIEKLKQDKINRTEMWKYAHKLTCWLLSILYCIRYIILSLVLSSPFGRVCKQSQVHSGAQTWLHCITSGKFVLVLSFS